MASDDPSGYEARLLARPGARPLHRPEPCPECGPPAKPDPAAPICPACGGTRIKPAPALAVPPPPDPGIDHFLRCVAVFTEHGVLPLAGGWCDQSPWFADGWAIFRGALGALRAAHDAERSAWRRKRESEVSRRAPGRV